MILEQSRIAAIEDKLQYQSGDVLERHMRLWGGNKADPGLLYLAHCSYAWSQ